MPSNGRVFWSVTTGGGLCRVCGWEGQVVATPNRQARLIGWLFDGQTPSAMLRCPNGHEWPAGSTAGLKAGHRPLWWNWLVRVMRVLIAHRAAEPVPVFWIVATVVGVTLGFVVQVIVGGPWWLVAMLWLLLVWLGFLATALSQMGRDGLWIDLVNTVSPLRAEVLETNKLIKLAATAPGPVYGLASWEGPRSLGGHGRSSSEGLTHLELMYGDPPDGPHLRVNTVWRGAGRYERPDVQPDHVRQELARLLWYRHAPMPEDTAPEERHQWAIRRQIEIERRPDPGWTRSQVLIDGVLQTAEILVEGDDWVAVIYLDGALIGLQAYGVHACRVALAQVRDLTPFAEGSRQNE